MKISCILLVGGISILLSCKKSNNYGPQVIPDSLIFVIKKDGNRLSDSILNNMKMSYFENGIKNYMSDFVRATNEGPYNGYDLGIQGSRLVGILSSEKGIKNYFLEYPDGSQDTLYVDYRLLKENEAKKDPCYCYYPLTAVNYNHTTPNMDTSIKWQKVFLFSKN
jgi:hypothetical protein